jgi:hypothetical protein
MVMVRVCISPVAMTPAERTEMERLVGLIQAERDPGKFSVLIGQLNALLARKKQRLSDIQSNQARKIHNSPLPPFPSPPRP